MPKKSGRNSKKAATAASILGTPVVVQEPTTCVVCLKKIPAGRVQALKAMNVSLHRWTCMTCTTTPKVKGLYLGEVGTSELQLCDKVYNDSVRSVFRRAEVDTDESEG